jgi:N-methylhydantoinase A
MVEVVTLRVVATANVETLKLPKLEKGGQKNPDAAKLYVRDTVFDDGKPTPTTRYARGKLKDGDTVSGPALIVQHNSTTLVPPGYLATVLTYGDIHVARS